MNQYYSKVDHHFSDKDRIFGRIAISESDRESPTLNPNFTLFRVEETYNVATQWVHTFNQNMINEFRFGFQEFSRGSFGPRWGDESFNMAGLGIGEFNLVATDNDRPLTVLEHGFPDFHDLQHR